MFKRPSLAANQVGKSSSCAVPQSSDVACFLVRDWRRGSLGETYFGN